MLAFPTMLIAPAQAANMKTPEDADSYNALGFPHFHVFCLLQLGQALSKPDSHLRNAEIIAAIPEDRIMKITYGEIRDLGFEAIYA